MESSKQKVFNIIAEQFSVSSELIKMEYGPGDLPGWDSIGQLQLILKIEQFFGIALSVDDVMSINNIGDIVRFVGNDEDVPKTKVDAGEAALTKSMSSSYTPIRLPRNIYQGFGALNILNDVTDSGNIVVITTDASYGTALFEKALSVLNTENEVVHIKKTVEEPKEYEIVQIANKIKSIAPELIIAIGGGSVIDTGKLSWLLYENPEFDLSNIGDNIASAQFRKMAKFVVIPTTFGSGAEASSAAAFTTKNDDKKSIVVSHDFLPDYVFLDASMGDSLPKEILFSSAFDAVTHAIEGYVSLSENIFVKPLAVTAIRNIINALKDILDKGSSHNSLERLCYSSYWAGVVQNHCSVGATHAFAHKLSERGISHGLANAAFLVPVMKMNASKSDVYQNLVKEVGYDSLDMFINELKTLIYSSGIIKNPQFITLSQDQESIVNGAMEDITFRTNPVLLTKGDMIEVLNQTIQFING
jgi:alcohol dehydrogenase